MVKAQLHRRNGAGFRRGTAGFTLIEILVVVVILGIAAAIVVPAIGSRDDLKTTSAARMVMADLIYAQNRSISQQKMHWVRFDKAAQTYEILEQMTPTVVYIKHPVEASNFIVQLGDTGPKPIRSVKLDTITFDGKTILAFDELGTPYSYDAGTGVLTSLTAGSVKLESGPVEMTITIEPFSGELRLN